MSEEPPSFSEIADGETLTPKNRQSFKCLLQTFRNFLGNESDVEQQACSDSALLSYIREVGHMGLSLPVDNPFASQPGDDTEVSDSQPLAHHPRKCKRAVYTSPMRTSGPQKRQRISNNDTPLMTLPSTLLPGVSLQRTIEIRDQVFSQIETRTFFIRVNSRASESVLGTTTAAELCNFFFYDLLSRPAHGRLHSIMEQFKAEQDSFSGEGPAAQTDKVAHSHSDYEPFASFFKSVAQVQRTASKPNNLLQQLYRIKAALDLHHEYKRLIDLAKNNDPGLKRVLNKHKAIPARGVSHATCIINYTSDKLGQDRQKFRSSLYHTKGFAVLERKFGTGILVFLPLNIDHKLQSWGKYRLTFVTEELHAYLPELGRLCSKLAEDIYFPIVNGEPLGSNITLLLERGNMFPLLLEEPL